jgi:FKBP-type peptidyl-prolyl cis-trans isomerase
MNKQEKMHHDECAQIMRYIEFNHYDAQINDSGLAIIILSKGNGKTIAKGNKINVYYSGSLLATGECFDSNIMETPFTFVLGKGEVIKGWDEGLLGLTLGTKLLLIIPSKLAYGSRGAMPDIPPYATLVFEIEIK